MLISEKNINSVYYGVHIGFLAVSANFIITALPFKITR
jgi:hypothetical protein